MPDKPSEQSVSNPVSSPKAGYGNSCRESVDKFDNTRLPEVHQKLPSDDGSLEVTEGILQVLCTSYLEK